ncbi:MAG: MFS transporter [Planctomycetia bacterium]|nr:MFS transporter [Planctomycetia bacterium]
MNQQQRSEPGRWYPWYMLLFLWGAFFLNQGDRQLFNNVLPLIEEELGFTPIQLSLVAMIFTICYGIFVPIAGYAGDRIQKRFVVLLSLLVFSLGTLATGLVPHADAIKEFLPQSLFAWCSASGVCLGLLIVARSVATGIGEAFYYPAANSLIAIYHEKTRATAMAVHQTANYTGVVFGGSLAAWVGYRYGWRVAFYCFGTIGIIWALAILLLFRNDRRDLLVLQRRASMSDASSDNALGLRSVLAAILSRPTFYLLALAFGGMCFVNVGFLTWMPRYLIQEFNVEGAKAGFDATFYHHVTAYVSVFIAAAISDSLALRIPAIRMVMEFIGLLLGAPFIWLMGYSDSLVVVYLALAGFGLFRGIYDSNLFAAMFDVIEPRFRATASGIMLAFAFVIGSLAPWILALLAESLHGDFGPGLASLAYVYLGSAFLILLATLLFYKRDRLAAEQNESRIAQEER